MRRYLLSIFMVFVINSVYAVDATKHATKSLTIGKWQITEFAAPTQMIYRLSSDSINFGEKHIVFDFLPSRRCTPSPAVMIIKRDAYNPDLDDGRVMLAYKIPNQVEASELTKTVMQRGDTFVFFQFVGLTTTKLLQSKDAGNLAVWVPGSFDGTVKRSDNEERLSGAARYSNRRVDIPGAG